MNNIPIEEMPEEIDRLLEINEELKKEIERLNNKLKETQDCLKDMLHMDNDKENDRLNNIINELEEWLKKEIFDLNGDYDYESVISGYENVLNKLKELKGSDKE